MFPKKPFGFFISNVYKIKAYKEFVTEPASSVGNSRNLKDSENIVKTIVATTVPCKEPRPPITTKQI